MTKSKRRTTPGLSGKTRLALEFLIAGFATWLIVRHGGTHLYVPFKQGPVLDLGWFYIVFGAFVIVAFGNSVNLTDGLDGLATMPVIIASLAFLVISYLVGNARFANYLGIPHVLGVGDLTVLLHGDHRRRACLPVVQRAAGRGLHGRHRQPRAGRSARRGSVATHHEFVLVIVGGLFVVEALVASSSRSRSTSAPASACS